MENRFNLRDEPWIPVADEGLVSLTALFKHPEYRSLGGNPVQKIALLKLLQAIAQAAATPQDMAEWQALGVDGMAKKVLAYLKQWRDRFYLYGDKPFLQIPAIATAKLKPLGTVVVGVAAGNTTILTQSQVEKPLTDGEKSLLLLTLMGCALGGGQVDNSVVLTENYLGKTNAKGKPSSGKPGPSVAHMGLLHNFCVGETILTTVWLNLFTQAEVKGLTIYPEGLGVAPWEEMPAGEDCAVARRLKATLMGRLIPLSRFCLLASEGMHYSEGIAHSSHKDGVYDPSICINQKTKEIKVVWTDPSKRPWRELTGLLEYIARKTGDQSCIQLRLALDSGKVRRLEQAWGIWSGGLRVSSNAGEQYASGTDDFVESTCWFPAKEVGNWFNVFEAEMLALDKLSKTVYGCVIAYYKELLVDGKAIAANTTHIFWQLCERDVSALIEYCDANDNEARLKLRRHFANYVEQVFNQACPSHTARQIATWAKSKPNLGHYLQEETL